MHKEQTMEQVYEYGDIVDCHYKNMNILESYQKYRSGLVSDEKNIFRKK